MTMLGSSVDNHPAGTDTLIADARHWQNAAMVMTRLSDVDSSLQTDRTGRWERPRGWIDP
jgi:hypothetical protein